MAHWFIGIDEHGGFNPLEETDEGSFVCGVVTRWKESECEALLQKTFRIIKNKDALNKKELLGFFHGLKHTQSFRVKMLNYLREAGPDCISKIVVSRGRPQVVSNPQQWWTMAVQSVLQEIFAQNLFDDQDSVNIYVASRTLEVIGFYKPGEIPPHQLVEQPETISEAEESNVPEDPYRELHKAYHKFLGQSLSQWAKSSFPQVKTVTCVSASISSLVTLADQAVNMSRSFYRQNLPEGLLVECPCKSFLPDGDAQALLADGEFVKAIDIVLDTYFNKRKERNVDVVPELLEKVSGDVRCRQTVLSKMMEGCRQHLGCRGSDGQAINRVNKMVAFIDAEKELRPLPSDLVIPYGRLVAEIQAHSGSCDLNIFNWMEEEIRKSKSFTTGYDRWKNYLSVQLMKSQVAFNGYSFDVGEMKNLGKALVNSSVGFAASIGLDTAGVLPSCGESSVVDDDLAAILGTLGQAAAFNGNFEEALTLLERDFGCTSPWWKPQVASYLVVVYFRKGDWDKCMEWFEKQSGQTFDEFGNTFDAQSDTWLVLNYLRLYALGLKQGRSDLPAFPEGKRWKRSGDYPYALVRKWAGLCLILQNNLGPGCHELRKSYELLRDGLDFAIRSLALSVCKLLYKVQYMTGDYDGMDKAAALYNSGLEDCKNSESFAKYVEGREEFLLPDDPGQVDLWDAALMLPFNYA